jgi:predicted glutamine amidotransferase
LDPILHRQWLRLRGQYVTMNLAEIIDPRERGYLVASKPLSKENWTRVKRGQLLIFFDGEQIFASE